MGKTSLRKQNNVPLSRSQMKNELYRCAFEEAVRNRIISLIKENNLTEYKLSQIAGISRTSLNDVLNGNVRNVTFPFLFKIANSVNIPMSVFLYGLEDEILKIFNDSIKQ